MRCQTLRKRTVGGLLNLSHRRTNSGSFATSAARAWNKHEQWAFITEGPPKEAAMRLLLLMLGLSVCVVGIRTRAEAQNYPWCAIYSDPGGGTNCGFTTFQQCMDTA